MQEITFELIILFIVGCLLLIVVGVQYYLGKVYTRGRGDFRWHQSSIVSKQEAPLVFWSIIGLQSIIGLALVLVSGFEAFNRLF